MTQISSKPLKGNITFVSIADRLDASNAADLETRLDEIVEADNADMVISLKELVYISSAGLRVLLSLQKLHADQKQLYFAELDGYVKDIFKVSGFYSIFTICDTVEEAVLNAQSKPWITSFK